MEPETQIERLSDQLKSISPQEEASRILELEKNLKDLLVQDLEISTNFLVPHLLYFHRRLRELNWPLDSICISTYFAAVVIRRCFGSTVDAGEIFQDVKNYFEERPSAKIKYPGEWLAMQICQFHEERFNSFDADVVPPSLDFLKEDADLKELGSLTPLNFGSWILKKMKRFPEAHSLFLIGSTFLAAGAWKVENLVMPDDELLDWVLDYDGIFWLDIIRYCASACGGKDDERCEKLCHICVQRQREELQKFGGVHPNPEKILGLFKFLVINETTRRVMIRALTSESGLILLNSAFGRPDSSPDKKFHGAAKVLEICDKIIKYGTPAQASKLVHSSDFLGFFLSILPNFEKFCETKQQNSALRLIVIFNDLVTSICASLVARVRLDDSLLTNRYISGFKSAFTFFKSLPNEEERDECDVFLFTILFRLTSIMVDDATMSREIFADLQFEMEELASRSLHCEKFEYYFPIRMTEEGEDPVKQFLSKNHPSSQNAGSTTMPLEISIALQIAHQICKIVDANLQ